MSEQLQLTRQEQEVVSESCGYNPKPWDEFQETMKDLEQTRTELEENERLSQQENEEKK